MDNSDRSEAVATQEVVAPAIVEVEERTASWAGIGASFSTKDAQEALRLSGLDWTVEKRPLWTDATGGSGPDTEVAGYYANVTTNGDIVGVVSGSYEICQNADAFQFANHVSSELTFIKGGMTARGLVYMIGQLQTYSIMGDEFTPHLIFQNSFNTVCGVKVAIIPLRVVCQNQFNIAWHNAGNTLGFRHSSGLVENMENGAATFQKVVSYMDDFQHEAESLASRRLGDAEASSFLDKFFAVKPDMTPRQVASIGENRERFVAIYNREDNQNFTGTMWGMVNAYSDYLTHPRRTRGDESRFNGNLAAGPKFNDFIGMLTNR